MDIDPSSLQYGEEVSFAPRTRIFSPDDDPGEKPVFYIIAGLVKVEYRLTEARLPLYLAPDTVFGLVDPLAESKRLCSALTLEKTILYRWSLEDFFTEAGVSYELARLAIRGMSRELRILNAEFGERIGVLEGSPG
jgi:CRP-like cAMP-binding protein